MDIGAGTGHHLGAVLASLSGATGSAVVGLAVDSSPRAARVAARVHPRIGSVVADAWSALPVSTAVADAVLCIFAPRNPAEFARILAPTGRLVVVTPNPDHLTELIGPLRMLTVGAEKDSRLAATLGERFQLEDSAEVRFVLELQHDDLVNVVLMGPAARHVDRAALRDAVSRLPEPMTATGSVTVTNWALRRSVSASAAPTARRPG